MHTPDFFDTWLTNSKQGRYIAAAQKSFLQAQMRHIAGRAAWASALSLSENIWQDNGLLMEQSTRANIISRLPHLPLLDNSIQTLFLPHALDLCHQHDVLLKECFRILEAQGRLVLTGFNPHSLWRFSRAWQHAQLPTAPTGIEQCKNLLLEHGFSPNEGRFMAYAPAWFDLQHGQKWRRMEAAGDRWWPHHGALYGLCAIKQIAPLKPIHAEQHAPQGDYQLVFTAAGRNQSTR